MTIGNRPQDPPADEQAAARIRVAARRQAPRHRRLVRGPTDSHWLTRTMLQVYGRRSTPPGYAVLTTTGRHSGRPRSTYVRVVREQDRLYAVMLRPPELAIRRPHAVATWVWNIRADPNVTVRLRRHTYDGVVREIVDPVELRCARQAICDAVHPADYGECLLHLKGMPTRRKIEDLHRYWVDTGIPLVIEIRPASGSRPTGGSS
jgi:deazaflavin-dependent oxidoreductase (nitroreductase family)